MAGGLALRNSSVKFIFCARKGGRHTESKQGSQQAVAVGLALGDFLAKLSPCARKDPLRSKRGKAHREQARESASGGCGIGLGKLLGKVNPLRSERSPAFKKGEGTQRASKGVSKRWLWGRPWGTFWDSWSLGLEVKRLIRRPFPTAILLIFCAEKNMIGCFPVSYNLQPTQDFVNGTEKARKEIARAGRKRLFQMRPSLPCRCQPNINAHTYTHTHCV